MASPALLLNTLGTTLLAVISLRSERVHSICSDAFLSLLGGDDAGIADVKLREAVDEQRIERFRQLLVFFSQNVDMLLTAVCLLWMAQIGIVPDALSDNAVAAHFTILGCLAGLPCALNHGVHSISKNFLRIAYMVFLAVLVAWQLCVGDDTSRCIHCLLRVAIGIVISDFTFSSLSNVVASVALGMWLLSRHSLDHCAAQLTSEATILAWITGMLWASQEVFRHLAENSLQLQHYKGQQRAMWSLLEAQYHSVIHVGSDARVSGASTRFLELIGHPEPVPLCIPRLCTLDPRRCSSPLKSQLNHHHHRADEAPEADSSPLSSGIGTKALNCYPFADFIASKTDLLKIQQRFDAVIEDENIQLHRAEAFDVELRGSQGVPVPIQLYHSCFIDSFSGKTSHLFGVCEIKPRRPATGYTHPVAEAPVTREGEELGKQRSDSPEPDPIEIVIPTPASTTTMALCHKLIDEASQDMPPHDSAAVLIFDIMDPEMPILQASEQWTSLFGSAEGNLPVWLGPRLVSSFKDWVAGKLQDVICNGWTRDNCKQKFRRVAGRYPNGAKLKTTISLIFPKPSDYFNAGERTYVAMLVAESTGAHSLGSGSSASSRSGKSSTALATVVEGEDEGEEAKE